LTLNIHTHIGKFKTNIIT